MTNFIIERAPVTTGLRNMLLAYFVDGGTGATDLQVAVGEAPRNLNKDADNQLVDPYAIIYPITSQTLYVPGIFRGTLANPDSGATLAYQITSVGRTDRSAQIMADRVRRAILERAPNGSFIRTISAGASMTVIHRTNREIGLSLPDAGVWSAVDLYELEVQANV